MMVNETSERGKRIKRSYELECGCAVVRSELRLCPLHDSAPRMVEALRRCKRHFSDITGDAGPLVQMINAALPAEAAQT